MVKQVNSLSWRVWELGAFDQAIIAQDEIIQSVSKPWDIASALTDMIELYRLTADYQGLKVIQ